MKKISPRGPRRLTRATLLAYTTRAYVIADSVSHGLRDSHNDTNSS